MKTKSKEYKVLANLDVDDDILVHRYEKCDPLLSQVGAEGCETCSFTMAANKFLVQEDNSGSKWVKNDVHHVEEIAKPNVSSSNPAPLYFITGFVFFRLNTCTRFYSSFFTIFWHHSIIDKAEHKNFKNFVK
jgi:hypothetical protein